MGIFFEIGTVNLAFLTFCHATVLQNSSLNPCLKFALHFSIVADGAKPKRFLIENRFGFDLLTIGFQDAFS